MGLYDRFKAKWTWRQDLNPEHHVAIPATIRVSTPAKKKNHEPREGLIFFKQKKKLIL